MKTLNVFVVDDDADDLENVSDAFATVDCAATLHLSPSLDEMLKQLADTGAPAPDLIVLDHQTPGAHGSAAVEMLRSDKRFAHTAVVIYSSHVTDKSKQQLQHLGADLCYAKGTTMNEIRHHVMAFCHLARQKNAGREGKS